jgi:hypothetical protein
VDIQTKPDREQQVRAFSSEKRRKNHPDRITRLQLILEEQDQEDNLEDRDKGRWKGQPKRRNLNFECMGRPQPAQTGANGAIPEKTTRVPKRNMLLLSNYM